MRLIVPWLLIGVFAAGIIKVSVTESVVTTYVGGNSLRTNFIASFLGALMEYATLTEVSIIRASLTSSTHSRYLARDNQLCVSSETQRWLNYALGLA